MNIDRTNSDELYESHIGPYEGELLSHLISIRRRVDVTFYKKQAQVWFDNPYRQTRQYHEDIFAYPHGNCLKIRNVVLNFLLNIEKPHYIKTYLENGGILQDEWLGFYRNSKAVGFSNVITFGDRVIDPVNEEFSGTTIPIRLTRIGEEYQRLDLKKYKEIAEEYHQVKIFSSVKLLGNDALFLPFISLDKTGQIDIVPNGGGVKSNIESLGMEAFTLLSQTHQYEKLSDEIIDGLHQAIEICLDEEKITNLKIGTPFESLAYPMIRYVCKWVLNCLKENDNKVISYDIQKNEINTQKDFLFTRDFLYIHLELILGVYNLRKRKLNRGEII